MIAGQEAQVGQEESCGVVAVDGRYPVDSTES